MKQSRLSVVYEVNGDSYFSKTNREIISLWFPIIKPELKCLKVELFPVNSPKGVTTRSSA